MTTEFREAAKSLTDIERESALRNILENASETEAGIIRQLLGKEKKPLTKKQKDVYENNIEKSLVEKCGITGCGNFVPAGTNYCPNCEVKYGS